MDADTRKYKVFQCYNMRKKDLPMVNIKVPLDYVDKDGGITLKGQRILENKGYIYIPSLKIF